MAGTNFKYGLKAYGAPVVPGGGGIPMTTGTVFFVDSSTGNDNNLGKDTLHPFATLDYAIGKCTDDKGDQIIVMPGHAETVATVTCDVDGIQIYGLGRGRNIPAFTGDATAVDLFNITGDSVYIENIRMVGAATMTAFINVAGPDFTANTVGMDGVATPENFVTIAALGTRFNFFNCRFESQTNGPNYGILFEVPDMDGWRVEGCTFNFHGTGLDDAGMSSAFHNPGGIVKDNIFIGMDVTAIDFNSSTQANCEGIICGNMVAAGANVADIDTLIDAGGYGLLDNWGTDLPAEGGGLIPVTTPA